MKNIKDITISIFAIIGFAFLLSSFTPNGAEETEQQVYGTPESHVWEFAEQPDSSRPFLYNKVTGEVRKYNKYDVIKKNPDETSGYITMKLLN